MSGGKRRKNSLGAGTILLSVFLGFPALAQPRFIVIEPQPLAAALVEFAEATQLSINYSGLDLSGLMTDGTSRNISPQAALRQILTGTDFDFQFIDNRTVQIFKRVAPQPTKTADRTTPSNADDDFIDELVVTAIKRPATSFELPVSVSGVSSIVLEDLSAYDFQALAPHLAGVSTTNLGPGRNKIFVRGLSDGPFADRTQAVVGVYIDETPINFSDTNPDIRLFDAERVELIRGPQGTLYGAGSLGGIYKIVTNKPELDETFGKARASFSHTEGGGENGLVDVVFNSPLVRNELGFRFAGYTDIKDGYIDNVALDLSNTNDLSIYGGRAALRWKTKGNWLIDGAVNVQSIRYDDSQYFERSRGRNKRASLLQEPYDDDFIQANLTVQGRVGDVLLTSATAIVDRTIKDTSDASMGLEFIGDVGSIETDLLTSSDLTRFGGAEDFFEFSPVGAAGFFARDDITIISHETRLQSENGKRFNWLVGAFYLGRKQTSEGVLGLRFSEDQASIAFTEYRQDNTDDIAVFGEAIWKMQEDLSLTAGLRYSHSTLKLDYASVLATDGSELIVQDRKTTNKVIPKIALRYEWTPDVQTYAQVSVGYRVGGININTPLDALQAGDPDLEFEEEAPRDFQSDTLVNYEAGIKSYWFDRRFSINVSAFYVRWFDIQSDQINDDGLPFVTNVGNARNLGYEVEFAASPFNGLELRGSFFWNDSELLDDNPFLDAQAGDRLPTIPENTVSMSTLYQFGVSPDWQASISANYAYIGASALRFDEFTSPEMGDYGILNAAIQVTDGSWKIGVFANNLTDTRANTFAFGNSFSVDIEEQVTPPRPRTFGFFIERRF